MNKEELLEKEIQKTLQCFGEGERLVADPYFYTRLKSKLSQKESVATGFGMEKVLNTVTRPSFVVVLLIINILTMFMIVRQLETQMNVKEQYLRTFASYYSIPGSSDIFGYSEAGE